MWIVEIRNGKVDYMVLSDLWDLLERIMDSRIQENDVIVVGSGPGGATVAKELSARNKKVLILEWGDNNPLNRSLVQSELHDGNIIA